MKVALFGGSFDPVHNEHVRLVRAAIAELGLDRAIVMPSFVAPHKRGGAEADGKDRLAMCRAAFSDLPQAEVSDEEIEAGGTSYSYLTCRRFAEQYPAAERYFLLGADMLENFFFWKEPEDILKHVVLVACGRGERRTEELREKFRARFGADFLSLRFCGKEVSSTDLRVALAFGKRPSEMDERTLDYIEERGLYRRREAEALKLEKPERREHSYRVALYACRRAKSLDIPFEKALVAAMLHDCGKYVPLQSPLLSGFVPPADAPPPVLHQFTGAYLAEHAFGVRDEEILNAVRYHTSGRKNMSALEKLIYLSDLLEVGRTFRGVEALRELFWRDLDACLARSLKEQVEYLKSTGMPLYPLTLQAEAWYNRD